jgi:hypothetical protein
MNDDFSLDFVADFSRVGFSGSRSLFPCSVAAMRQIMPIVSGQVFTGCADGADELARNYFSHAKVFNAADYGKGRGSFAARSIACVRAVAPDGLWVAFPSSSCPPGLMPSPSPSRCFNGSGSGTWGSLALAVGLGCNCLVFIPPSVACPVGWGLVTVGGGWHLYRPNFSQLSLFS